MNLSNKAGVRFPLVPGFYYHLYNRANSGRKLFYKDRNYVYFLRRLDFYLLNYLEILSFCLMPNHFHFLVKIKSVDDIFKAYIKDYPGERLDFEKKMCSLKNETLLASDCISKRMNYFLSGYTKAINKQQEAHGSLFEKGFRRKLIKDDVYLRHLVRYIHNNPVKHGFVDDISEWSWSSYRLVMENKKDSKLSKKEVMEIFDDDKDFYKDFHRQLVDSKIVKDFILE